MISTLMQNQSMYLIYPCVTVLVTSPKFPSIITVNSGKIAAV